MNKIILSKAKEYVGKIFREKGPKQKEYHNFTHTAEVVKVIDEISSALNINDEEKEILLLAGWFHDIGYTECYDGHEKIGIDMAINFLRNNNYPDGKIDKVAALISSTKMPRKPQNQLEKIICDADLHHLGIRKFSEKEKLFRNEVEKKKGHRIKDKDWLEGNLNFMNEHKYYTEYAREKFGPQKIKNLNKIQQELRKAE